MYHISGPSTVTAANDLKSNAIHVYAASVNRANGILLLVNSQKEEAWVPVQKKGKTGGDTHRNHKSSSR